ncbi:hypothetical protein [Gordonia sp. NB41Y]|uniref:hypothetical protein n=1 Tax=Gordonia sp. NB41Y TaxID=875808 RepID=UPI0002BE90FD|nr:hypothetical protein [Gordonia sp. NB41Y]EMP13509.1 hypothetical protein ISGA_345 [Gordonia sp. NB41Y]WLP91446.1 hypothetical protein Q9K23_04050 [Gordonia sp. NB41Y]
MDYVPPYYATDDDDEFLPVGDAAERLDLTVEQVHQLVRQRVLRARRVWGILMVQPAIVTGYTDDHDTPATTDDTPPPRGRRPRR